jgi:NAD(P)-dependent dehydrogenase (short-subunit alcohol dehydrogenase family)
MEGSRKGPVAVVTGGTGALGRWVVKVLLEQGATVHVPWIVQKEADELPGFLGDAAESAVAAQADITSAHGVERYFAEVTERAGRLDVLCNVAGGFTSAPIEQTTIETWEGMLRLNATSAFLCSRAAAPLMKEAGGGRIVNVAALPAVERGAAHMSAYAASKAALLNLTYSLARELRPDGISVNAVAPEILDTPGNRKAMPKADPSKWVRPEEAARVIAFLASRDASVVTGSVLVLGKG